MATCTVTKSRAVPSSSGDTLAALCVGCGIATYIFPVVFLAAGLNRVTDIQDPEGLVFLILLAATLLLFIYSRLLAGKHGLPFRRMFLEWTAGATLAVITGMFARAVVACGTAANTPIQEDWFAPGPWDLWGLAVFIAWALLCHAQRHSGGNRTLLLQWVGGFLGFLPIVGSVLMVLFPPDMY